MFNDGFGKQAYGSKNARSRNGELQGPTGTLKQEVLSTVWRNQQRGATGYFGQAKYA